MLLKNNSARLHHVGDVSIAPLETKEVPDEFRDAFNKEELEEVTEEEKPKRKKRGEAEELTEGE